MKMKIPKNIKKCIKIFSPVSVHNTLKRELLEMAERKSCFSMSSAIVTPSDKNKIYEEKNDKICVLFYFTKSFL